MQESFFKIPEKAGQTKVQQLVYAISEAIVSRQLQKGKVLPSINELSTQCGFSRDTVFKAYKILKSRNLIDSAPTRGYYVTGGTFNVFMLLDDFSAFKEQLYQSFRANLPEAYSVDLLFHHYNHDVFNQLIQNSIGRYSFYIVMNIDHKGVEPVLEKLDAEKLLILDMGRPATENISFVVQDFDQAVENCLENGWELLKKYHELILVYDKNETPHPLETADAVQRFCKKQGMRFKKIKRAKDSDVNYGECWFAIRDSDLVEIIKKCRVKGLQAGKDIGILSFNDTPMKQIVGDGISVISTSFKQMGLLASTFIKSRQKIRKVLPTSLIIRGSI